MSKTLENHGHTEEWRLRQIIRELERIALKNGAHWIWCEEISCRRPFMVGSGTGRRKTARFCSKKCKSKWHRGVNLGKAYEAGYDSGLVNTKIAK